MGNRYGFYISGAGTRVSKFLSRADRTILEQIALVFSDSCMTEPLKCLCEKNNISMVQVEYKTLDGESNTEKNRQLSDRLLYSLQEQKVDYCFSFGSHILSGSLLNQYHMRLINFHPALLPMFPGIKAIDQAAAQGNVFLVGNTAHFIDEGIDTGPVIMQSAIPLQAFYESGGDYDCILDIQITMLNHLIYLLSGERIRVEEGKVRILGAEYQKSYIFPAIKNDGVLVER